MGQFSAIIVMLVHLTVCSLLDVVRPIDLNRLVDVAVGAVNRMVLVLIAWHPLCLLLMMMLYRLLCPCIRRMMVPARRLMLALCRMLVRIAVSWLIFFLTFMKTGFPCGFSVPCFLVRIEVVVRSVD